MQLAHRLLVASCVLACLFVGVSAQFGLQQPQPRTTGEIDFRQANQPAVDFCDNQMQIAKASHADARTRMHAAHAGQFAEAIDASRKRATALPSANWRLWSHCPASPRSPPCLPPPQSAVYSGSPNSTVNTIVSNANANSPQARVIITMVQYRQNGSSFNPRTNISTPIYYLLGVLTLYNETAVLKNNGQNQNQYMGNVSIPNDYAGCGVNTTDQYGQTRCVLRYVYDESRNPTQNSRVSCADVVVYPRSADYAFNIQVRLGAGDVPIQAPTALNRLLGDPWATSGDNGIEIFTDPDDPDGNQQSTNVRLRETTPIEVDGSEYTIHFLLSGTPFKSSGDLAASLFAKNLSAVFDLNVIGVNDANTHAASIIITIATAVCAWMLQRAA